MACGTETTCLFAVPTTGGVSWTCVSSRTYNVVFGPVDTVVLMRVGILHFRLCRRDKPDLAAE